MITAKNLVSPLIFTLFMSPSWAQEGFESRQGVHPRDSFGARRAIEREEEEPLTDNAGDVSTQEIDPGEFREHLQRVAHKVPEFLFLRGAAWKYGLRIWLFGGSASSFAHYVKDRILWQRGEEGYYATTFEETPRGELDFTNIFRPTQDIDLVVDGSLENVQAFEQEILGYLPDIRGNRKTWEVRTLRVDYGDKTALLNNFDFLNQHTDSHSVGLVALSDVSTGEIVRDLRDWNSSEPQFLSDVLEGRLHYYYSELHEQTSRYREGKNPPIISVIRALIKVFQHELEITDEIEAKMKLVIARFKPGKMQDGYVRDWLDKNAPKLFLNSRDVEYSWNKLEALGLRKKLLKIGDIRHEHSVAWWMNKEPLRSFPVGKGWRGRTAASLGVEEIAHDTRDFLLWTIITSSRRGKANMFISRGKIQGERAAFGEGVYGVINSERGLWGNGLSVRFSVDPGAKEGRDFIITNDDIGIILNNNAVKLIPESLSIGGLVDYFYLFESDVPVNRALIEKLKIRIDRYCFQQRENPDVKLEIDQVIEFLRKSKSSLLWEKWLQLKIADFYPGLIRDIVSDLPRSYLFDLITGPTFIQKYLEDQSHWMETILQEIGEGDLWEFAKYILTKEDKFNELIKGILAPPHWAPHSNVINSLLGIKSPQEELWKKLDQQNGWHEETYILALEWAISNRKLEAAVLLILSQGYLGEGSRLIEMMFDNRDLAIESEQGLFKKFRSIFLKIQYMTSDSLQIIEKYLLSQERWKYDSRLVELSGGAVTLDGLRAVFNEKSVDC